MSLCYISRKLGDCSLDTSLRKELKAEKIKLFFPLKVNKFLSSFLFTSEGTLFFLKVNKFLSSKMVQSEIDAFIL